MTTNKKTQKTIETQNDCNKRENKHARTKTTNYKITNIYIYVYMYMTSDKKTQKIQKKT